MFKKGSFSRQVGEMGVEICAHFVASNALRTISPIQTHPVGKVISFIGTYALSNAAAKAASDSLFSDVDEILDALDGGFTATWEPKKGK